MGKYMRKCKGAAGEDVAAVEVTQVVGVRTRSRSASAAVAPAPAGGVAKVSAPRRRKALPPAPEMVGDSAAAVGAGGGGGSCYLQLRSRMLFKAAPPPPPPSALGLKTEASGAGQGPALLAVLSRCSSTASSADVSSHACRAHAEEAGGDHVPEGSVSNLGSGCDRERRETTPSSLVHGDASDLESDLAGQKSSSRPQPPARPAPRLTTPPAAEIEEFFAAAEAAEAKRFASKYNFDVVRGVPLDAGRYEWTPVVSI
ncbi:hypothetical protein ACP4OV_000340 [Aristida adscensionis]